MGGVMGVNKSQEEEIQQVETAGIVADKLPPIEEYEKTRKKNKKHAVCGLTLLIAIEAAIAGAFGYQISEKNLNTRVFREHEIRSSGKIQLTQGFYSGETNFGLFEGNGIFSYDIGEEYSGNWHDDQISGEGTLRVPTEGTYKGDFSRSKKMAREFLRGMMVLYMMENGKMTRCADKVPIPRLMVLLMKARLKKIH